MKKWMPVIMIICFLSTRCDESIFREAHWNAGSTIYGTL